MATPLLGVAPTDPNDAVDKGYVDAAVAAVSQALDEVLTEGNDGGALGMVNVGTIEGLADGGFGGGQIEAAPGDAGSQKGGGVFYSGGLAASGNQGAEANIGGGDDDNNEGGYVNLRGGAGVAAGAEGGSVNIVGGQGDGDGGDITLDAGQSIGAGAQGSIVATGLAFTFNGDPWPDVSGFVTNPMSADLDPGGFNIAGLDRGAGVKGDDVLVVAGQGNGGTQGRARLVLHGGTDTGAGGTVEILGGNGEAGQPGGPIQFNAGNGDGGAQAGAGIIIGAGTATDPGRVGIYTDGTYGDLGDIATAQGDGTLLWQAPSGGGGSASFLSIAKWS